MRGNLLSDAKSNLFSILSKYDYKVQIGYNNLHKHNFRGNNTHQKKY